jgi:hypothetical protein
MYGRAFSYESYKYLTSRRIKPGDREIYRDYIAMAKECGHNIMDKYWYAPKNLHKAHEKVMAEVELSSSDESYEKPDFIGKEVTGDRRYYNSHLLRNPYKKWKDEA